MLFRLRLSIGPFIYFKFTTVFFYLIFLMKFLGSIKEIDWIIGKGMLSIYFKVTNEKN